MKHEYFESVWDAIEPDKAVAANPKARAYVMVKLEVVRPIAKAKKAGGTKTRRQAA